MGTDNVAIHRFIIDELEDMGIDRHRLFQEIGLPAGVLAAREAYLPSKTQLRLWEIAERELDDSDIAIKVADRFRLGRLGLLDYLFAASPTLLHGLAINERYSTAISTNHYYKRDANTGGEVTLSVETIEGEGRGRDLTQLWTLATTLTRCRRALDAPLDPLQVTLRQPAPRNLDAYTAIFGSAILDFDAPIDAITFRAVDTRRQLVTQDPTLARVLQPLADALPPPPTPPDTWIKQVTSAISQALDDGQVSLPVVAHLLIMSPRTLQRRLREAGTTWRRELDRARATRLAEHARDDLSRDGRAQLLAYADPGSTWRAARRWSATPPDHSQNPRQQPVSGDHRQLDKPAILKTRATSHGGTNWTEESNRSPIPLQDRDQRRTARPDRSPPPSTRPSEDADVRTRLQR
ncbi:AraC family transcriptional regulator ligand-binding domain-containing protein [Nocardia cyriacigeorgica]|uniref:AraC family transcriptional regulator ligand-binding domain-containing protein n=1 Tax=Nocardia cyriacigeorgica TaxID=135487 RepID=UPI0024567798|nr:AraC family transcriptional regulator ligand-binding domain-containing protein [Nocardia cyriacigeorgica]